MPMFVDPSSSWKTTAASTRAGSMASCRPSISLTSLVERASVFSTMAGSSSVEQLDRVRSDLSTDVSPWENASALAPATIERRVPCFLVSRSTILMMPMSPVRCTCAPQQADASYGPILTTRRTSESMAVRSNRLRADASSNTVSISRFSSTTSMARRSSSWARGQSILV